MDAAKLLADAAHILEERASERDGPNGERSMARCVASYNEMTGHELTVEDGWQFMVFLKFARMRGGGFKDDDYVDAIDYTALMAEEAINLNEPVVPYNPDPAIIWSTKYKRYIDPLEFPEDGLT